MIVIVGSHGLITVLHYGYKTLTKHFCVGLFALGFAAVLEGQIIFFYWAYSTHADKWKWCVVWYFLGGMGERKVCLKWDKKNKELYRCHEEKGDCFVPCTKMMSFWCLFQWKLRLCLFLGIHFPGNHFPNFTVCLTLEKLVNGKHFPVKGKFSFVSRKMFSWKIWAENTFRKLWKI